MVKEIFGIKAPEKECSDKKCPFHGEINVKKEFIRGKIISRDINNTATIEWFRSFPVYKYERFEKRRSRLRVHNPECINAQIGETVLVARTRPLSKSKNHVIINIIEK
jgi:small subunit ribosomal protein S17